MEYLKRPERLGLGAQAVIQAKPKRELKMGEKENFKPKKELKMGSRGGSKARLIEFDN